MASPSDRGGGNQFSKQSKKLSWLLRHHLDDLGVPYRPDGFVRFSDLVRVPKFRGLSLKNVQEVVRNDNKQRFALSEIDGEWHVRANQGHTIPGIDPDQLLTRLSRDAIPPDCIHGTTLKAWEAIQHMGLCRMARNHVHFAQGLPGASGVISGMRASSEVLIHLDVAKAMDMGCLFFLSQNGVLLSPGLGEEGIIPPECFSKVTAGRTGEEVRGWHRPAAEGAAAARAALGVAADQDAL